jgi:hypothetical protein
MFPSPDLPVFSSLLDHNSLFNAFNSLKVGFYVLKDNCEKIACYRKPDTRFDAVGCTVCMHEVCVCVLGGGGGRCV